MASEIFISYKHTDSEGNKTPDHAMAEELSTSLRELGYDVFFSSDTLEQMGSSRFKADIDAALDTARVMIVVLSRAEYASSQWVQYEWDSFYNDYLSGVRPEANLFTLTAGVGISELPRTLRNVQNFRYDEGIGHVCDYIKNALPKAPPVKEKKRIEILTGREVTAKDITDAAYLDRLVYDDIYLVTVEQCEEWIAVNPDIYVMARDTQSGRYIAYAALMPVTDECYAAVMEAVGQYGKFDTIYETDAGCTVSCHCGPATLGVLFVRK